MRSLRGKIVEVEFYDHAIEYAGRKDDERMVFKVWGRVERINKKEIIVLTWEHQSKNKGIREHNSERARILMSAVKNVRFLELIPEPVLQDGH